MFVVVAAAVEFESEAAEHDEDGFVEVNSFVVAVIIVAEKGELLGQVVEVVDDEVMHFVVAVILLVAVE